VTSKLVRLHSIYIQALKLVLSLLFAEMQLWTSKKLRMSNVTRYNKGSVRKVMIPSRLSTSVDTSMYSVVVSEHIVLQDRTYVCASSNVKNRQRKIILLPLWSWRNEGETIEGKQ